MATQKYVPFFNYVFLSVQYLVSFLLVIVVHKHIDLRWSSEPTVLIDSVYAQFSSNAHVGLDLDYYFDFSFIDSSGSGSGETDLEEGIMCFSSNDCGACNGEAPVMASSREECCLMSPFQQRSFVTTNDSAEPLESHCVQCIGM